MRLFVDENVPRSVVEALRAAGHDVAYGSEFDQGSADVDRVRAAFSEQRVILTEDNEFPRIVFHEGLPVVGLIMISLHGFARAARAARVVEAVTSIGDASVGMVHVIEPATIRMSRLPK